MNEPVNLDEKMIIDCLQEARKVLEIEAYSVLKLKDSIGSEFADIVRVILESKGRVIFTGIGKSGLIGQKLAATFSSTGTPAFFCYMPVRPCMVTWEW